MDTLVNNLTKFLLCYKEVDFILKFIFCINLKGFRDVYL